MTETPFGTKSKFRLHQAFVCEPFRNISVAALPSSSRLCFPLEKFLAWESITTYVDLTRRSKNPRKSFR